MLIVGCDFHTRYQQIAIAREETGELLVKRRLDPREARSFLPVRVGIRGYGADSLCVPWKARGVPGAAIQAAAPPNELSDQLMGRPWNCNPTPKRPSGSR
jgi:hypothetical protein